eukprot:c7972_g1_i3.p1 GENE.c7972_g1_i3~~c7972_g1_i3.p1  ORF type:complete len:213 (+),score=15.84 c7972_g1_i3:37-675(+)
MFCLWVFSVLNHLPTISPVYANATLHKPDFYSNRTSFNLEYGDFYRYRRGEKLGHGHFSVVYRALDLKTKKEVAMKWLTLPVRDLRVKEELLILNNLFSGTNVVNLLDTVKHPSLDIDILVLELVPQRQSYKSLFEQFNDWDARYYLYETLKAIDYAHSMGIIHRDIKPGNIVFDTTTMKVRLCDWGLATFYFPDRSHRAVVAGLKQAKVFL